jgi:hypothetical protein
MRIYTSTPAPIRLYGVDHKCSLHLLCRNYEKQIIKVIRKENSRILRSVFVSNFGHLRYVVRSSFDGVATDKRGLDKLSPFEFLDSNAVDVCVIGFTS